MKQKQWCVFQAFKLTHQMLLSSLISGVDRCFFRKWDVLLFVARGRHPLLVFQSANFFLLILPHNLDMTSFVCKPCAGAERFEDDCDSPKTRDQNRSAACKVLLCLLLTQVLWAFIFGGGVPVWIPIDATVCNSQMFKHASVDPLLSPSSKQ